MAVDWAVPKDKYMASQPSSNAGNFKMKMTVKYFLSSKRHQKICLHQSKNNLKNCFVDLIENKATVASTAKHSDTDSDEEEEDEEKKQAAPKKKKCDQINKCVCMCYSATL